MDDHIGLIKRLPHADVRRGAHVKLLPDTHAALRLMCTRKGISMQEFFEEMAVNAVNENPSVLRIMEDLVNAKRQRYFKQLSETDAESLYDAIARESPFR